MYEKRYFVQREPWLSDGCLLHVRSDEIVGNKHQCYAVVAEEKLIPVAEGSQHADPFLRLDAHQAQSLFDAFWNAGYRPNKGEASAAHVEAMRYHMEDLRKLVFKDKYASGK